MTLSARFRDALLLAAELHADQTRKGTAIPYVAHLMTVCAVALEAGCDEDTAIAALLHDAIEDQGGDAARERIRKQFGGRVAAIVDECSDSDTDPKPPWRVRKEAYIRHLPAASPEARLICAADKLHNARSVLEDYRELGEIIWDRFKGGRDGTLWYYRAVADALRQSALDGRCRRIVERLEETVCRLEAEAAAGRD